ncbi:hypothetical protein K439DRAFT_1618606 [Ramaria rubella]|nr:hypothetical protein K439DRAFT_1618606 [Ramaria rubella]
MLKRIPLSFASRFAKPITYSIPSDKWSLTSRFYGTRISRRWQRRLPIIAGGVMERWIFKLLMRMQPLLEEGKTEEALALCHQELLYARFHRRDEHDAYHRAISLFTRHRKFSAATSLCKHMLDEGFEIPNKTLMVLLRGMRSNNASHVQEIRDILSRGGVKLDDLSFKALIDSEFLHGTSPDKLEAAFELYSATRGEGWVAPIPLFGTIIRTFSLAGNFDRAQEWLDKYRETIAARDQCQNLVSNSEVTGQDAIDSAELPRQPTVRTSRLRFITSPFREDDCRFPYAALLMGYTQSPVPLQVRVEWLFERMRQDGVAPDVSMCNMLIPTFFQWGWSQRAYAVYRSMTAPGSLTLPDAYTFRHVFIALNPVRKKAPEEKDPPEEWTAREVFKDLIVLERLRLFPRRPQPHKNLISMATFNCALRTFTALGDYAGAWTVLACSSRYHLHPDRNTMRGVIVGLLRRIRKELTLSNTSQPIMWVDRFIGQRCAKTKRPPPKIPIADCLFAIGSQVAEEMDEARHDTYIIPSSFVNYVEVENELKFLVALLRHSLLASLGYSHYTRQTHVADKAVRAAMLKARGEMIPRGRTNRN